jgi:hypothetical protein
MFDGISDCDVHLYPLLATNPSPVFSASSPTLDIDQPMMGHPFPLDSTNASLAYGFDNSSMDLLGGGGFGGGSVDMGGVGFSGGMGGMGTGMGPDTLNPTSDDNGMNPAAAFMSMLNDGSLDMNALFHSDAVVFAPSVANSNAGANGNVSAGQKRSSSTAFGSTSTGGMVSLVTSP